MAGRLVTLEPGQAPVWDIAGDGSQGYCKAIAVIAGGGGGGGSGTVTSVATDATLTGGTITTTGTLGINLSNTNTWLGQQTFVAPVLGAATCTTLNKVTITQPASGSTLTIANGATLSAPSNATVSGTNTGDQTITLTGAVTGSGTGSFATTLTTSTAYTWSAIQKINLNTASAPTSLTGTLLQLSQADTTAARLEINAFGAQAFFTSVGWGGTKASPTALTTGTQIGGYNSYGYNDASVVGPVATFRAFASENWASSGTKQGSYAEVATTLTGSATLGVVMRWENDGGVTVPATVTGGSKGAGTINCSGGYYSTILDAATATVTTALTLCHNTSGTAAASFGTGILLQGQDSTTASISMAAINTVWTTATHASRTSQVLVQNVVNAVGPQTALAIGSGITGATAYPIVGGYSSTIGAIWSSAVTPSTSNHALSCGSSATTVNAAAFGSISFSLGGANVFQVASATSISITNAVNIAVGTSNGTILCTATTQKLGFWNATPVVQPASTGTTTAGYTQNASANAVVAESTFTGNTGSTAYTISDVVKNLKTAGLLAA